eukprot:TRINITY_DN5302_c0_g1_i5.p2 TRINITY_DN5302_c0_g1~~TRINITY_DN5302_c0_g1_i5.p2  ORF type:complete len:165 (-),score=14.80 TRINITY_DN5302_c0_g1_i5:216-677(-)
MAGQVYRFTTDKYVLTSFCRRYPKVCRGRTKKVCQATGDPVVLSIGPTTLQLPLTPSQLQEVSVSLESLIKTFQEKAEAKRPKRWESTEYRYTGAEGEELQYLEVFCNPNAYQTAFDAKVLVTLKTQGGINLTTEMMFSSFKQSLDACLVSLQ